MVVVVRRLVLLLYEERRMMMPASFVRRLSSSRGHERKATKCIIEQRKDNGSGECRSSTREEGNDVQEIIYSVVVQGGRKMLSRFTVVVLEEYDDVCQRMTVQRG